MLLSQKLPMALHRPSILLSVVIGGYIIASCSSAIADKPNASIPVVVEIPIPTGKMITPTAARGAIFQDLNPGHATAPDVRAGQAAALAVSPDGRLLAILTSGFNFFLGADGKASPELITEYVFLFDITGPQPKQLQVLRLPHAFQGLAWAPSSDRIFASGGCDDAVVEFVRGGSTFTAGQTFHLGHKSCVGRRPCRPETGGLALSPDGTRILVANLQNDSVSEIDLTRRQVVAEQDLRPGIIDPKRHGQMGGSFPRSIAWSSPDHAYVASERDREIISLAISKDKIRVIRRMPVHGQPVALIANRSGSRLYAALDTTNQAAIFETAHDRLLESLDVTAPGSVYMSGKMLGGANTNALALTPDELTLLVTNGGQNSLAVVRLSDRARDVRPDNHHRDASLDDDERPDIDHSDVVGLVPTGWYPTGVATSKDGAHWYIVNFKSPTGPNVRWCRELDPVHRRCVPRELAGPAFTFDVNGLTTPMSFAANGTDVLVPENQYIHQLEKAGFLTVPAPTARELARLTKQVARNNRFDRPEKTASDESLFSFLREHIKHVIYIMKENRTYDQVLGDLEIGNGDRRLTLFPEKNSPNHHAVARNFVTLDNFLVSGEASWTGWNWTFSAQTTDLEERAEPLNMADFTLKGEDGLQAGSEANRGINVGYATIKERRTRDLLSPSDQDILPGARNVYAPDGPGGEEGKGTIWDAALRRGLTVRNWGVFADSLTKSVRDPYAENIKVSWGTRPSLMANTDPYYRGFEPSFPDYWRIREWKREFANFVKAKQAPNLMIVQLANDHLGWFDKAIDGVNTPETQMADNDYALGLLIETVADSPFARDTLIVSIEDDALDGPDHVDAHRSIALFAGPYVHRHRVVSTSYTTVNVVKTIEEILGIGPIGLNDALAAPMSDVFDLTAADWTYKAIVPDVLYSTKLPLPTPEYASKAVPRHSATYWTKAMADQDFSGPDRINPRGFNRALWRGLKGKTAYPVPINATRHPGPHADSYPTAVTIP